MLRVPARLGAAVSGLLVLNARLSWLPAALLCEGLLARGVATGFDYVLFLAARDVVCDQYYEQVSRKGEHGVHGDSVYNCDESQSFCLQGFQIFVVD